MASKIQTIARTGLISKGIVYCLLGALAFMAAFHINGKSVKDTDKEGVFGFIQDQTGGQIMLAAIALGLLCYTIWRWIQAFADTANKGDDAKGLATRARYFFSGAVYASLAFYAAKLLMGGQQKSQDSNQNAAQELLSKPFGQWMAGIAALILVSVGIYQVYYGLSEKYKKHVEKAAGAEERKYLFAAGKVGYVSRGIVWLLIGFLFVKAALHANSSEAGDTSKALGFLEQTAYGPYLLALVALGLICYGAFNFIRARYENFDS